LFEKITQKPRQSFARCFATNAHEQALRVTPMLVGRAIARKMKIIEHYNVEVDGNRK